MKRIVSLFLSVSLVAVAAFALVACKSSADKSSTTVYGINYSVTNDNTAGDGFLGFATVKKYVLTDEQKKAVDNGNYYGNMIDLVIPAVYETGAGKYKVNAIAPSAFADQILLRSITIGDSVTTVGEACLSGCVNLESVTVAFAGESENAVDNKKTMGYLFGVTDVSGCSQATVYHNGGDSDNSKTYYIPDSLKTITLTGNVVSDYAFNGLPVKNVVLSGNVETIPEGAFANMKKISSISLPASVKTIGKGAFKDSSSLMSVNFSGLTALTDLGAESFSGCSKLSFGSGKLDLPASLENVGVKAFYNCTALEEIDLTRTAVAALPEYAFYGCEKIDSVKLSAGVTLAKGTFANCEKLTKAAVSVGGTTLDEVADTSAYTAAFDVGFFD